MSGRSSGEQRRWIPDGEQIRCTAHDERFARGQVCSKCTPDDDFGTESSTPESPVRGLSDVNEHERKLCSIARSAEKAAKDKKAHPSHRIKYLDVAVRARRAAVELARWREDWERVGELEAAAKALKGPTKAEATTEDDNDEVRH